MLTWKRFPWILALLLTSSAPALAQDGETSRLTVVLRMEQGRFVVDREVSRGGLRPSKALQAVLGSSEELEDELFDGLDRHFKLLPRPARSALDGKQQKDVDRCEIAADAKRPSEQDPSPERCKQVMGFVEGVWDLTVPWSEAQETFDAWAAGRGLSEKLDGRLESHLPLLASTELSRETPLFRSKEGADAFAGLPLIGADSDDTAAGRLVFKVANPTGDDFPIAYDNFTTEEAALIKPSEIRRLLRPLRDRPWVASEIQWRVKEFYGRRGLDPKVTVTAANSDPSVRIIESARILEIQIPAKEAKAAAAVETILYLLLDDKDFKKIRREGIELQERAGFLVLSYARDLAYPPEELPLFSRHRLNQATVDLAELGFTFALGIAEGKPKKLLKNIVVQAFSKKEQTSASGQADETPGEDSDSGKDPDADLGEEPESSQDGETPGEGTDPDKGSDSPGVRDLLAISERRSKPRFFGGGVDWRPDRGVDYFALFRVRSKNGTQAFTLSAGGFDDNGQGDIDYSGNFLGFQKLGRPLSLRAKTGVVQNGDRLFGTEEFDEKRERDILRAELEIFRNRRGQSLSVSAGLRQDVVELSQDGEPRADEDVSVLDIVLDYQKTVGETAYPWNLKVQPTFRRGVKIDGDEPEFDLFALELSYHRLLSSKLEVDVRAHAGFASGGTPIFEQPSQGGAESLRGFRGDAAIAERAYSVQGELWTPLVIDRRGAGGLRRLLAENVRLAIFADIGETQRSAFSADGTRAGAGVGLRLDMKNRGIVVALDWGYGFETPVDDEKEGKFYFSLRQNID